MLQQKIVLKVNMQNPRCRTKAMKIAAVTQGIIYIQARTIKKQFLIYSQNKNREHYGFRISFTGVTSVALEGPERDQMVVVGIGVDSATLANLLRIKVGKTTFISVAEVKPDLATKKPPDEATVALTSPWSYDPSSYPSSYSYPPTTNPGYYLVSSNSRPPSICSIM